VNSSPKQTVDASGEKLLQIGVLVPVEDWDLPWHLPFKS
jgi:hypothetical protein